MTPSRARGGQEVSGVARIEGPIVVVDGVSGIGYDEMADIVDVNGRVRRGRVLEVGVSSRLGRGQVTVRPCGPAAKRRPLREATTEDSSPDHS